MKPKGAKKFKKTNQLTNALAKSKNEISEHARIKYMSYPAFHDFVALLFVYNDLLNMRDSAMNELFHFFCEEDGRVLMHRDYFTKNQVITEAYTFVSNVIKYIKKQNSNPKHTWYLKI